MYKYMRDQEVHYLSPFCEKRGTLGQNLKFCVYNLMSKIRNKTGNSKEFEYFRAKIRGMFFQILWKSRCHIFTLIRKKICFILIFLLTGVQWWIFLSGFTPEKKPKQLLSSKLECVENNYLLYSSLNIFCDFIIEGASRLKEWVRVVVRNLRKKKENELAARPTNPLLGGWG